MKIVITLFSEFNELLGGKFSLDNNFYYVSANLAGSIVAIRDDDDWLDGELGWVARSEIPFITAIRLSQVSDQPDGPIWGSNPSPQITKYGPDHGIFSTKQKTDYKTFPTESECIRLLEERVMQKKIKYSISKKRISLDEIKLIYKAFDYKNDLLIRAGSCMHKAHTLESLSLMFSEEIYVNLYIAFEALIEYLVQKNKKDRKHVLEKISEIRNIGNFLDYEEEMRDGIRNNIIHPWRNIYQETNVQPMTSAEYILEDLPFVDWLFRQVILGKIKFG